MIRKLSDKSVRLRQLTYAFYFRITCSFITPTDVLIDTKTDALIRQAFREEIPDTTRIIIAQRVSSVEDADVIIVMDKGEISGIGTSEELLKTNAIYREVYESQMKGGKDSE